MGLRSFDAKDVAVIIAGVPIESGFAEGEFMRIVPETEDYGDKVGVDGEVARYRKNDNRATVTLILMQTSTGNDILSGLRALGANGLGNFLVQDTNGTSVYTAAACWIQKQPDVALGTEVGPREWTLRLANYTAHHGSNA